MKSKIKTGINNFISQKRKELINQYATAAVSLYGAISIPEFVDVFNYYEEEKTDTQEVRQVLSQLAKTDDAEYSLFNDMLSGPQFQPEFDDYNDIIMDIRENQAGKQRYLPNNKDEFLRYVDYCYREPEKPYAELKAYIIKHKLTDRGEGLDGIDGDLIDLHEMIQFGESANEYINYFDEMGYKFKNIDAINSFIQVLMNVHNNTRMYYNNGFTPSEIVMFVKLPTQNIKINVNQPCPCGSGKKYKKCCGEINTVH